MTEPSITPGTPLADDGPAEGTGRQGFEPTGHDRIDQALERLADLDQVEIVAHPERFDEVHRVLRESLASAGHDEDGADGA